MKKLRHREVKELAKITEPRVAELGFQHWQSGPRVHASSQLQLETEQLRANRDIQLRGYCSWGRSPDTAHLLLFW